MSRTKDYYRKSFSRIIYSEKKDTNMTENLTYVLPLFGHKLV